MLSLLHFSDFTFKSYKVYAVKSSYDCFTLILCQTAARFFHDNRHTDELDAVKMLIEWLDNFVSVSVTEEDWRQYFRTSRRSLYKLVEELRVNTDTCGGGLKLVSSRTTLPEYVSFR